MDDSMDISEAAYDEGSSDFEPEAAPKGKAKAPAKAATIKAPAKRAPAKPKATKQTTLTKSTKAAPKAAAKKRALPDSDVENSDADLNSGNDDSLLSNTPPSNKKQKKAPAPKKKVTAIPLVEIENESFMDVPVAAKAKKGSEQYQKLTQLEHILKRPDTYIGSVEHTTELLWIYNSETDSMENRKVSYVPGLYKIFDEILVNAADNKQRDKNMNELHVTVDADQGMISVKNNGRGIPIEKHDKEGIWIPEMIFGHLLTSSNYDDDEAKVTGGRNGYGAKLTNIYSTQFDLETVDSKSKQKYRQTWLKNMSIMKDAKIDSKVKSDDYTKITFWPDFSKFGMDKMDADFEGLVKRRVYDMAGTTKGVKVFLNGDKIKISKFKQYMEMYTKAIKTENVANDGAAPEQVILTDNPHERWEIGFAVSDGSFQQVSFVNSIATTTGGTHVNYIADQICDRLEQIVNKKNKGGVKLKKAQLRNHIFLFVNALIVNPAFTSQTKEQLTTKVSAFGSRPQVTEKFLKDIAKTEVVTNILHFAQQKADKVLSKSDGNRRQRMNHSKLTDANKAGTKDGYKCTLILTEGDSAALLALAGRAVVDPDVFGVFPLRGKVLNVRDASVDQISKNAEIQNIKKFIGLQHKKQYTDTKGLRYGHIMIMTDQDHDGSHIKGLLINFLQVQYPSLLKIKGFLLEFITPIVKVWKGDPKKPKAKQDFFTMPEYEKWREQPGHIKGWEHKYYKGLGTSDTRDAQIYFNDLDRHLKRFHEMQDHEEELIDLAFSKKRADARKTWLQGFVPGTYLDMSGTDEITYDDFINKELILFSMADNMRSIPSVIDGLKPGQRKVMYTAFRRNLKKDIKVVELAGLVSGLTAYAYGDASLQQTIVALAQNFVGSNNMNILEPSGNFGSRLQGGSDAASARYIYTRLSPFARHIFDPKDEPLLKPNLDDGKEIEPELYFPILPMILINGAEGIGTGWSTSIPCHNPDDVINNLIARMQPGATKESMTPMLPWYRGWTGQTEQLSEDRYKFPGRIVKTGNSEVEITELPVHQWTQDFKDKLEDIIKAEKVPSFIKDYTEYNTPETVHFIIKMEEKKLQEHENKLEELFKLSKTQATSNLVAFDQHGRIHKYATTLDIMEEFYLHRYQAYIERKKMMLGRMEQELRKLNNQARFVKMIIDGKLVVSKKKKSVLVKELKDLKFDPFPKVVDAKKAGETEEAMEDNDEPDDAETATSASDYDYLLGMAIWSLTQERVEKLLRQVGEKEEEINDLTVKSVQDLWSSDLIALRDSWEHAENEERKRDKDIKRKGRRASAKLGIAGKAGKKRKAGDSDDYSDEDFAVKKPKTTKSKALGGLLAMSVPSKPAGSYPPDNGVEQQPVETSAAVKQMKLDKTFKKLEPLAKVEKAAPAAKSRGRPKKVADDTDSDVAQLAPAKKAARAKTKKAVDSDEEMDDDDEDDVFAAVAKEAASRPAAARGGRAAAQKAKIYKMESDEDSEFEAGNDMLTGDVSELVKGIGNPSTDVQGSRLFHTSAPAALRPTSSHGLKTKPSKKTLADISDDETNWAELAQNSPQKIANRTILSDGEGSMDIDITAKPVTKPAAQPKAIPKAKEPAALKPKKAPAQVATKLPALSPAAKAYAAKRASSQAKAGAYKKKLSSSEDEEEHDDVDQIANEILSDDEEAISVKPAARSRRAATTTTKKSMYAIDSDEEEEEEEEESEDNFEDADESFD